MDSELHTHVGHQTVTWERPDLDCPVEVALAAITGRWATLVLRNIMHGLRAFGELRRELPTLSAKVLTERLTHLQRQGLVECLRHNGFPATTTYRLTDRGRRLRPLLEELYRTGEAILRDRQA